MSKNNSTIVIISCYMSTQMAFLRLNST